MKRLFNGKDRRLCVDQWGGIIYARTVKELREKVGGGRTGKVYCDRKDGCTYQVGYYVGRHWFSVYAVLEIKQDS